MTTTINNLIIGKLYVDHYGTMKLQSSEGLLIQDHASGSTGSTSRGIFGIEQDVQQRFLSGVPGGAGVSSVGGPTSGANSYLNTGRAATPATPSSPGGSDGPKSGASGGEGGAGSSSDGCSRSSSYPGRAQR